MKSSLLGLAVALMTVLPAVAGDVPITEPRSDRPEYVQRLLIPSLADFMSIIQLRHIKLWYASQAKNWEAADYEASRIEESLVKAITLYNSIPVEYTTNVDQALVDMRSAIKTKNSEDFGRGFAGLTAACNSCHTAGNVGFIRIQIPASMSLSNQTFKK
jgi:hypothetical protein